MPPKEEKVVMAVITSDDRSIPLFRNGKYVASLNRDQAYQLEDQGKIEIKEGKAYQK